ncbi:MAG: WYL domain-containing protein [Candidatus Eremiobacteraeota bacterium]|nr:WYL domain-containing protein [Candidatus Eremiobacteraeota bacterium]MBC5822460.1 WYL domain-containing protein [Candidatus Eremiobacteraeota bacterium]
MFERHEIEALVVGVRLVEAWCGPDLAASARSALDRIRGAVPEALVDRIDDARVYAPRFAGRTPQHFEMTRHAIDQRRRRELRYRGEDGTLSERVIRPLGLYFWGKVWTVAAWCEMRNDFRSFRLDRIGAPTLREPFDDEPDKSLDAFLMGVRGESNP